MSAATQTSMNFATQMRPVSPVGELLLARISGAGGATRAEIANDLGMFVTHKLSPAEWRRLADTQIGQLIAAGFATEQRTRLRLTAEGTAAAARYLGSSNERSWTEIRDLDLVGKGLGLAPSPRLKMGLRPEGLRALILQSVYNLPIKKNPPVAKLRAQLALVALERAFGNSMKPGVGKGAAFTSKVWTHACRAALPSTARFRNGSKIDCRARRRSGWRCADRS